MTDLTEAAQAMVDEALRRAREANPDYDERPHVGSFVEVAYAAGFDIETLTAATWKLASTEPESDLAQKWVAQNLSELQDLYEKEQAS